MIIRGRTSSSAFTLHCATPYDFDCFRSGWNFFTGDDPTSGQVTYLDQQDATSKGLAFVQSDGTIKIGVDSTTQLSSGQPRNS